MTTINQLFAVPDDVVKDIKATVYLNAPHVNGNWYLNNSDGQNLLLNWLLTTYFDFNKSIIYQLPAPVVERFQAQVITSEKLPGEVIGYAAMKSAYFSDNDGCIVENTPFVIVEGPLKCNLASKDGVAIETNYLLKLSRFSQKDMSKLECGLKDYKLENRIYYHNTI